ncbi:hypothetical protein MXB_4636 [Myxobolus squamalis]|nr:hypothetical protein MXB_4636 [Myxobolus squamalis]
MTDNNNHHETNKEVDEVHLNYSPDTSLLLSLGLDEAALRTSAPQAESQINLPGSFSDRLGDSHLNPILSAPIKMKFNSCENPWELSSVLQNNVTYTFDPSQLNIMPLNEQMVPLQQMFAGQNFDQLHSQFESTDHSFNQISNLPFFPNQNFFPSNVHSGMDESSVSHSNAMQLIPIELNTNHFSMCGTPLSHQRTTPDVTSNIYVSKGTAKLSEAEDWTPNPNRLLDILSELEKLNDVICKLKDECDLPNAKPNLKRERNRLASKLKKKATHETNKIKLEGLEIEFSNV